ncbi:MAG TPA: hypothetical protein VFF74_11035, partial [Methylophilaceae bacterium]|nr:hypothetical protein [Methylophilaceae bacterium]
METLNATVEWTWLLMDDSEMADRIRSYDWEKTSVGPIESWPQNLKTVICIMLGSRFPMFLWWGKERINFYNDAYISLLGRRHPEALGMRAKTLWHDIWDLLGPKSELVYTGETVWQDQKLLPLERDGYLEEAYFTCSHSPVLDEAGNVAGEFCTCIEDTTRILSQRRHTILRKL